MMQRLSYKYLIVTLLFLIIQQCAYAQLGDVRGIVYDEKTGEPLIYTNVFFEGTSQGSQSDVNGFYNITKAQQGEHILMVTLVGYDTFKLKIKIEKDKILNQNIYLQKRIFTIEEVKISAEKQSKTTEVQISQTKLTSKTIKKLPSVGGEPDLVQYLQVLPGVIFTGDQGGQLYIRGGSPIQNKVLLDGMTIYNPFHTIGLFSIFETEVIKNVSVYSGGFGAEYGGRVSSVIDVTTREGNKKRVSARASVSPFMTRFLVEGPIKKMDNLGASSSYIFTSKYSYLDKTSKVVYPWVESENALPFSFLDFYGKLSFNGGNGSKLNVFGFNYNDNVDYPNATFGWNTYGGGCNFVLIPGQSKTVIKGFMAYSNYNTVFAERGKKDKTSSIGGFNTGLNFSYYFPKAQLDYGFSINGFRTTFDFFNSLGLQIDQNQNTTEIGSYVSYRYSGKKFVIEPSIRFDYYSSLSQLSPEPRLRVKYNISKNIRFKFGSGIYAQNFISTRSDKDIVNLFNGFLSAPEEDLIKLDGSTSRSKLQHSYHLISGVELDITKYIEVNIEPYYKNFSQLIDLNRNKQLKSDPDYMIEQGDSYGIDFSMKFEKKNYYLWVVYSLGYNTRNNSTQQYYTHYDRRHNVNIVATYDFGKHKSWEASARWNFGSGFPFTKTQGFYQYQDFANGIDADYLTNNGQLGLIYDTDLNTGRLPYYHRMDLSLTRHFSFGEFQKLDASFSLTNAYNRKNIFYFDRILYERVNQLPIIPALSLNYTM